MLKGVQHRLEIGDLVLQSLNIVWNAHVRPLLSAKLSTETGRGRARATPLVPTGRPFCYAPSRGLIIDTAAGRSHRDTTGALHAALARRAARQMTASDAGLFQLAGEGASIRA